MANTTIQISIINRDLLDQLGDLMVERFPNIWSSRPPYNAIVGYAVDYVLEDQTSRD